MESVWVYHEVGAVVSNKLVIPMVERGADTTRLGMIASRERLYFGSEDLKKATAALAMYIGRKAGEKNAKDLALLLLIAGGLFIAYVADQG